MTAAERLAIAAKRDLALEAGREWVRVRDHGTAAEYRLAESALLDAVASWVGVEKARRET